MTKVSLRGSDRVADGLSDEVGTLVSSHPNGSRRFLDKINIGHCVVTGDDRSRFIFPEAGLSRCHT